MSASASAAAQVRKAYRDLFHMLRQMPAKERPKLHNELRTRFRQPLSAAESVSNRLRQATDRAAFLRITTNAKLKPRGSESAGGGGRWIYKDGQALQSDTATGTLRDGKGRVVSNWDGKNLDPCSVTRHRKQLHRAGFVNNHHAKGIF